MDWRVRIKIPFVLVSKWSDNLQGRFVIINHESSYVKQVFSAINFVSSSCAILESIGSLWRNFLDETLILTFEASLILFEFLCKLNYLSIAELCEHSLKGPFIAFRKPVARRENEEAKIDDKHFNIVSRRAIKIHRNLYIPLLYLFSITTFYWAS